MLFSRCRFVNIFLELLAGIKQAQIVLFEVPKLFSTHGITFLARNTALVFRGFVAAPCRAVPCRAVPYVRPAVRLNSYSAASVMRLLHDEFLLLLL